MYAGIRSRKARALGAVLALTMASPVVMGAASQPGMPEGVVTCATPDVWTGSARLSEVMPIDGGSIRVSRRTDTVWRTGGSVGMDDSPVSVSVPSIRTSFRNDGAWGLRGRARTWAQRRGPLWNVDARTYPVGQREMVQILLKAGASAASRDGRGVYFRARAADRDAIVGRAELIIAQRAAGIASTSRYEANPTSSPIPSFDVAMLRMQGRWSSDPIQFVEALPAGVSIYTYGTSFVAHVPARMVDGMWDQIDMEGERVLLVGASSRPVLNADAAQAVRFCGGSALMGRFPTPTVISRDSSGLLLEAEGQRIRVPVGDVVMVVQTPPTGRGIEVALMRVVRR
jgi:hypothetical protein